MSFAYATDAYVRDSSVVDTLSKSECLTQSFKYWFLACDLFVSLFASGGFIRKDIVFALHGTSKDAV